MGMTLRSLGILLECQEKTKSRRVKNALEQVTMPEAVETKLVKNQSIIM